MKKLTSLILVTTMLLSLNTATLAENISVNDNTELKVGKVTTTEYISVSDYLEKYGGESNVNKAFNQAERKHQAMLLKAEGKEEQGQALLNEVNESDAANGINDVLLSLKEGKFLGMEIVSVSDVPPTDIDFSIQVKGMNSPSAPTGVYNAESIAANQVKSGKHNDGSAYKIYYTDSYPSDYSINEDLYEDYSGSYFYKYGYSWKDDYCCTANFTFENTELHCGDQEVVMYVFIGATNGPNNAIDFGFIANPSASNRNRGLYVVRNVNRGNIWDIEAFPKVNLKDPNNTQADTMILEDKTVHLKLVIDQNGYVETIMYNGYSENDDDMIYYKRDLVSGFVSGINKTLSFFEAMSCVDPDEIYTEPDSGSYFKNVKFSNTKLYSYTEDERAFGTYGDDTYCVYICKPEDINYSYGSNTETVSIEYN